MCGKWGDVVRMLSGRMCGECHSPHIIPDSILERKWWAGISADTIGSLVGNSRRNTALIQESFLYSECLEFSLRRSFHRMVCFSLSREEGVGRCSHLRSRSRLFGMQWSLCNDLCLNIGRSACWGAPLFFFIFLGNRPYLQKKTMRRASCRLAFFFSLSHRHETLGRPDENRSVVCGEKTTFFSSRHLVSSRTPDHGEGVHFWVSHRAVTKRGNLRSGEPSTITA